jgi:recombinational DNA repair protein (RecF pathway)
MKGIDVTSETVVICVDADVDTGFTDNVITRCVLCQTPVQHRPHVPPDAKAVCLTCYRKNVEPTDVIRITPETMAEVASKLAEEKQGQERSDGSWWPKK